MGCEKFQRKVKTVLFRKSRQGGVGFREKTPPHKCYGLHKKRLRGRENGRDHETTRWANDTTLKEDVLPGRWGRLCWGGVIIWATAANIADTARKSI